MSVPLQISTNKEKLSKKVQVDGFTYLVRRPGAGESLTYRQLGKEMTRLEAKSKLSKSEQELYEDLRAQSITISLALFDSLGDDKAKAYIDSLDIQTILETIAQIFGEAELDEPASTDA